MKILMEHFSDICHKQWSVWMEKLLLKGKILEDGSVLIPKEIVEDIKRQMKLEYKQLSESEKENRRNESDRFLAVLKWKGMI